MDYPDSDEDGAAATDGAAILDDDEAEQIEDTGDGAMDQDQGDNTRELDSAGVSHRTGQAPVRATRAAGVTLLTGQTYRLSTGWSERKRKSRW